MPQTDRTAQALDMSPRFEMEAFMRLSNEFRLSGEIMQKLMHCWESWVNASHAMSITAGDKSYALIWLNESIEAEVDAAWAESPSEGFRLNTLAQLLCMELLREAVPETEELGCAPAPPRSAELEEALASLGMPCRPGEAGLGRRYAVLTRRPFAGGCDVCALAEDCPRLKNVSTNSVTLPGVPLARPAPAPSWYKKRKPDYTK